MSEYHDTNADELVDAEAEAQALYHEGARMRAECESEGGGAVTIACRQIMQKAAGIAMYYRLQGFDGRKFRFPFDAAVTVRQRYDDHAATVRLLWPCRHRTAYGTGGKPLKDSIRLYMKYMKEYRKRMLAGES